LQNLTFKKNAVKLNNSKNNSKSDYGSSSGENESSKNNSIPYFGLFGSLVCLILERIIPAITPHTVARSSKG